MDASEIFWLSVRDFWPGEKSMPEFEGTSEKLGVKEALERAVEKGRGGISPTDLMVSYAAKKLSGVEGGTGGFNKVTVVIDAELH